MTPELSANTKIELRQLELKRAIADLDIQFAVNELFSDLQVDRELYIFDFQTMSFVPKRTDIPAQP